MEPSGTRRPTVRQEEVSTVSRVSLDEALKLGKGVNQTIIE